MPSVGPQNPQSAASSGTGHAWSNPTNVFTSNNARASFTDSGDGSQDLVVTNFDFSSIPSSAVINGILVSIEKSANVSDGGGGGERINDSDIRLVVGGTAQGNNKALTSAANRWPLTGSEAYTNYGGESDTWGLSLTSSQVKASNFGVLIKAVGNIGEGSETGHVDHVRITVYYTPTTSVTKSAGTGANVTGVGTVAWSNPGNITASDNSYATAPLSAGEQTNYLRASNFGFNIPTTATIVGIEVVVERFGGVFGSQAGASDTIVRMVKSGTIAGDNKSLGSEYPVFEMTSTFGAATDLWGTTWTPSDINDSTTGVVFSANCPDQDSTASVDHVTMTVHYTDSESQTTSTTGNMFLVF
jgi:hypothetical protein